MAIHTELRPDDASLPLLLADVALRQSNANVTRISGMLSVDNGDGSETWIGGNVNSDSNGGVTKWIGDTTVPGKPTGLSAVSTVNRVLVSWNGTLHDGVPADFDHISVFVVDAGAVASLGDLNCAGTILSKKYAEGTILEVYAVAYDAARDEHGNPSPNMSEESDRITLVVERDVDMGQLNDAAADMEQKADAAAAKADKVRSDLTRQVQDAKSEMDSTVKAAQLSANKAQSAADAAQKAADKANASTADLDKTIQAVDAKALAAKQAAAEAQSKAENVASDLDSANAVIEQHTTELGELTTKVTNAVKKSDSALSVSTEAKQTATEASTTATSAYRDSQTALTQSTTATQTATAAKTTAESASKTASDSLKQSSAAVQTADQISTTLRAEYQTKADADKIYATQSSLKQTSDSITASVSKTYATKESLSALKNAADNAIESWRGTGVPTLTNKPAVDWTTDADKKKHSGDLYYDKATGKAYRFGSDDGETYTWELNQDTDVTKALADASKAQTSANNAQNSANAANTAAGKAQSTANTAVSNAATAKNTADAAQSSANKAQGDVDKLKVDIPATYATKSSLTQTAESITANVEAVKTTADSAVTAASKAQQTADGISANLSKNYQTKSQADTIYATKASLKATSDSISAEVTKAQGTADGAVTAASKAQQTADAVTLNLSKNYNTKTQNDALYATQTSLNATSDSLSAKITANAKTAQSAVDKATSLEANLNGFKTAVSQTYTTKADLNNLTIGGRNLLLHTKDWSSNWNGNHADNGTYLGFKVRRSTTDDDFALQNVNDRFFEPNTDYVLSFYARAQENLVIICYWYPQYNASDTYVDLNKNVHITTQWKRYSIQWHTEVRQSNSNILFRVPNSHSTRWVEICGVKLEKGTKPTDWSPAPEDLQPAGDYATNSSLNQTANSIKAQVTEVSKTANGAMSKATTVEQTANGLSSKITEQAKTLNATVRTANEAKSTADSNKATISQVSTTASSALTKASTVEQNLNGFKTTVSQTYTTNAATEELKKYTSRSFNLWGANGTGPKWVKLGYLTSNGDSSSVLLHVYSGDGYNGQASQNAEFEIFVKDGWQHSPSATGAFGVSVKRIRNADNVKVKVLAFSSNTCDIWVYLPWAWWNGRYTLQGNYKAWQDGPNCGGARVQDNEPTNGTAQNLAYDTLSTRSYVDQTSKSVALGVVQNYKGADGSGLATKSDITASEKSITSTVAGTYATKSGVTQEISSKVSQNNESLDVKFATKVEIKDTQTRVGSIETCIRNTADGVRVGYTKNGVYTGYSALVNSNGSFDVLNADGKAVARFNASSINLLEDSDGARGKLEKYKDGMNIACPQTYLNETPADGGYCWCAIKDYEVAGARQNSDSHGGFVSVIQYQESPGGQTDWTLTTDGRYLITPYDGWYLLNGIADVWKASVEHNIWAFYRVRYNDGTYGELCGATRTLCAVGSDSDPAQRWYRQNLPSVSCYLHAGDGVFMAVSSRSGGSGGPDSYKTTLAGITVGPRCQLNITKLPFGNIYHGKKEKLA